MLTSHQPHTDIGLPQDKMKEGIELNSVYSKMINTSNIFNFKYSLSEPLFILLLWLNLYYCSLVSVYFTGCIVLGKGKCSMSELQLYAGSAACLSQSSLLH